MPDLFDATDVRMEQEEKIRMDNHRQMMENQETADDCVDCGQFIPPARQQATGGTDMCITCLSIQETKQKGFR